MSPSNALCIVQSEISLLATALKCDTRFTRRYQDEVKSPIYKNLIQLKCVLNSVVTLNAVEPLVYLTPFLEVIRSEETTGPVTGLALTSVEKFLSYGLLELPTTEEYDDSVLTGAGSINAMAAAAEAIAESGTQARFVGTDMSSDEVVLMKVLQLLRTLLLVPVGSLISDRVVREILQSCFRICFEPKLSELLRRTAELCLGSIIQLLFSRLPSLLWSSPTRMKQSLHDAPDVEQDIPADPSDRTCLGSGRNNTCEMECTVNGETELGQPNDIVEHKNGVDHPVSQTELSDLDAPPNPIPVLPSTDPHSTTSEAEKPVSEPAAVPDKFVQQSPEILNPPIDSVNCVLSATEAPPTQLQPYGLPAIHDLLHYLISLLSPEHNSDAIISVSLGIVTIALETGADAIAHCPSLLQLVQGDLTKHLLLLLYSDRVWLFAAALRMCFMLFESMRKALKLQMEACLQRLISICSPDKETTSYERREAALEWIVRLFFVPNLTTELYVNYDCDPYRSNLFEDITEMLAKNAYPVDRLQGTHLLALDALLTVLNTIGTRCRALGNTGTATSLEDLKTYQSEPITTAFGSGNVAQIHLKPRPHRPLDTDHNQMLSREQLNSARAKKKLLILGSDQFNTKPKQGIAFLQQAGCLRTPLDPDELAHFLDQNALLDKRMIGEYLSDRNNEHILAAYMKHFNFTGIPIHEALRAYLEAFRLPGESQLIERVMQHFSTCWYEANGAPFANTDAAFTLAVAILVLNTDQHNPNSKKQYTPMSLSSFKDNVSGVNGDGDFDHKLLESIFNDIRKREIIVPCEQSGLVRENYLWKCLLRRAQTSQAAFVHTDTGALDADLFELIWGPTVSALSFIFDKTLDPDVQSKVVHGFIRCAAIAAHHGMSDVLDNLVISLCKFTTLLTTGENPAVLPVSIGRNAKIRLSLRLVFALVSSHADILRYGWHSLLDCLLQLFRASLLPNDLTESDDFLAPSRRVRLTTTGCVAIVERTNRRKAQRGSAGHTQREGGVLSSVYQYFTSGSSWASGSTEGDDEDEEIVESPPLSSSLRSVRAVDAISDAKTTPVEPQLRLQEQLRADYWAGSLHSAQLDEHRASRLALETVQQCEIVQLLRDTKFLVEASLTELIKALLRIIRGDPCGSSPSGNLTDSTVGGLSDDMNLTRVRSADALTDTLDHTRANNAFSFHPIPSIDRCSTDSPDSAKPTPRVPTAVSSSHPIKRSLMTSSPTSASYYPAFFSTGAAPSEDCRIFCLELLIRVLLHNRDRVYDLWPLVQCYLADLLLSATEPTSLIERVIVGFLRLSICLLRRHEMIGHIFACLHYILLTRGDQLLFASTTTGSSPNSTTRRTHVTGRNQFPGQSKVPIPVQSIGNRVGLQMIVGLTQMLRDHAADLPDPTSDWQLIFDLLKVCGAGMRAQQSLSFDRLRHTHYSSLHDIVATDALDSAHLATSGRGYTSDSEAPPFAYSHPSSAHPSSVCTTQTGSSGEEVLVQPDTRDVAPTCASSTLENPDATWVLIGSATTTTTTTSERNTVDIPSDEHADSPETHTETATILQMATTQPKDSPTQPFYFIPSCVLAFPVTIGRCDGMTLKQAADCLDFLIRDPAHITPDNFEYCVRTLRVFVEACLRLPFRRLTKRPTVDRGSSGSIRPGANASVTSGLKSRNNTRSIGRHKPPLTPTLSDMDPDSDLDETTPYPHPRQVRRAMDASLNPTTSAVAIQLLDLIYLLFKRATSIYTEWTRTAPSTTIVDASSNSSGVTAPSPEAPDMDHMWTVCWCPLLQATARLCCDCRKEVRSDAMAYLQRALLSPVLHSLSGEQWVECFEKVMFPLLSAFLESIAIEEAAAAHAVASNPHSDQPGTRTSNSPSMRYHTMEFGDPRTRAIPLLTKVFLLYLRPLHQSTHFHALWIRMLAYIEHFMQASSSDFLTDAVRESLRNVLLVMFTGTNDAPPILLRHAPAESAEGILWNLTDKHLASFLPQFLDELFPIPVPQPTRVPSVTADNNEPEVEGSIESTNPTNHDNDCVHTATQLNTEHTTPGISRLSPFDRVPDPLSHSSHSVPPVIRCAIQDI